MLPRVLIFKRFSAEGGSVFSAAAAKKTDGQIEKETNSSPQRPQRAQRELFFSFAPDPPKRPADWKAGK
jgi:hypothetical protein